MSARAFQQTKCEVERHIANLDVDLEEGVADHGRGDRLPATSHGQQKSSGRVEIGRRRLIQDVDLDALDRLLRAIVDDDPAHVTRLRRC